MSRHFWKIAIVTGVLPSRDFEIKGEIVRIVKTKAILERLVYTENVWKYVSWHSQNR